MHGRPKAHVHAAGSDLCAPLNRLHGFNVFLMILLGIFHEDDWKSLKLFLGVDFRAPTVVRQTPMHEKMLSMEDFQNIGKFLMCAGNGGVTFENDFQLACLGI